MTVDDRLYLYGGDKLNWRASDDRVRKGKSQSYLTISKDGKTASFNGTLDTQTLGGAGFASQRTADEDLCLDLSAYDGIVLSLVGCGDGDEKLKKKYALTLSDVKAEKRISDDDDEEEEEEDDGGMTVVPSVAAAFAIQALFAVPSTIYQSERFYDISGSVTVLAVGGLGLFLPALRSASGSMTWSSLLKTRHWRQIALTAMAMVWTIRLGSYLFQRVLSHGTDSRFDKIRNRPLVFASAFAAQATWVSAIMMPVIALNAVPSAAMLSASFGLFDLLGFSLWAAGLTLEATADRQKGRWLEGRRLKQHDEPFLSDGLFSFWSVAPRFPNYLGEITLWTGLATVAASALARRPVQLGLGLGGGAAGIMTTTALALLSPAMTTFLLTQVSGIPLSEAKYDDRYGDREDYRSWKRNTPRLLPGVW
ncbi:hypothetical protein CP533_1809 [Ophiocordyceps camponoti-saundersi (nom. inval.)]|nr:hypothetical protein CP533_1809 [Ophiocordyceps camponoti-saundersi (nom. inval.)]